MLLWENDTYKQLQRELTLDLFYDFTIADYSFIKTLLFARQNLRDDEFRMFQKMFVVLDQNFPQPDLLVYFHRTTDRLQDNINKRGREYEQMITDDYLGKVQNSYFEYFRNVLNFPVLILDVSDMDFVNDPLHYDQIKELLAREYLPGVHRVSIVS